MAKTLNLETLLNLTLVDEDTRCDELAREDAETYHAAQTYTVPLLKSFVEFFEESLLQVWQGRRPEQVTDIAASPGSLEFKIGDVSFTMKQPAANPSYADMVRGFLRYTAFMLGEWGKGKKIPGVVQLADSIYMSVDDVTTKLEELAYVYTGEKMPEIKANFRNPRLREVVQVMNISLQDYGALNPRTAKMYAIAKEQLKLLERNVIQAFRDAVKEEMGYEEGPADIATLDATTVGRFLIMDLISPREIIKYKDVFEGLQEYVRQGEGTARASGYGSNDFRLHKGEIYARIPGLASAVMGLLRDPDIAGRTSQHRIQVLAKPKYDGVVVH